MLKFLNTIFGPSAVRLSGGVFLTFLSTTRPSFAQDASAAAEALFNDARTAMTAKDYDTACQKFRESDRLDPAVGTHFNLANCEEQRGRLATAWSLYRQVLEQLRDDDPRAPIAREHAESLDARVPRLTLRPRGTLPSGTTVTVAELVLQAASFGSPLPLDPGTYAVTIALPGKPPRQLTVTLLAGDSLELGVAGEAPAISTNPAAASRKMGDKTKLKQERSLTPVYIADGVGAAGLLTGVVAGVLGLNQESIGNGDCNDATRTCTQHGHDANDHARTLATVSSIGFIAGAVGAGVGTYLWLTLPDSTTTSVGLAPAGQGAALEWRRAW